MPVKSILPAVYVPPQTLPDFLVERSREFSDNVIIIDGISHRQYTTREIWDLSARVGNGLRAAGLRKGSVVALFLPTCPEFMIVTLGSMLAGGITSGANPTYTPYELSNQLEDNGAEFVFTLSALVPTVQKAVERLTGQVKKIYTIDACVLPGTTLFSTLLHYPGTPVPCEPIDPAQDLAILPFSSGTTGRPKGVMLTHRNMVAALVGLYGGDPCITPGGEDVLVAVLPTFHIYGCIMMLFPLLSGLKEVMLPKFEPQLFLQTIQDYKATTLYIVPPILLLLAKHPVVAKYNLTSLTKIGLGAAPAGMELMTSFRKRFPHVVQLVQGFGMTECPLAATLHAPNFVEPQMDSCGIAMPNVEAKVIDVETNKELGVNDDGEICVRGPSVMKGYLHRPKETAEMLGSDGWLRTGDIGHYDEKGRFFIVDRRKELIKVKGFQVPPAELEDLLLSHPAVADAAVIGIPDERSGEAPRAYVTLKGGITATESDIEQFIADRVAHFKKLTGGVVFIPEIPKSPSGKILRRVLRDKAKTVAKL